MAKSANRLRDQALELADDGFDERVRVLADEAADDPDALMLAATMLTKPGAKARTREHVAFTYLSAAYAAVTGRGGGEPPK